MQENELPKNMGKKIVDALKRQNIEESDNENILDSEIDDLDDFSEESSLSESEDNENKNDEMAFDLSDDDKDYKPIFSADDSDDEPIGDMKLSIDGDDDVEEFEMPNNINVLRKLISQLPTGVPRHTGAQIIRQTIEALGIQMKTVIQDAQKVKECLTSSINDCNYTIQEYKSNIRTLEKQAASYQRQLNKLNDVIGLFVYGEKK